MPLLLYNTNCTVQYLSLQDDEWGSFLGLESVSVTRNSILGEPRQHMLSQLSSLHTQVHLAFGRLKLCCFDHI